MRDKFTSLLFLICGLLYTSCAYHPKCSLPGEGELSFPLEMQIRDNTLYVLNTDAGTALCSGFVSVYTLDQNSNPTFQSHIYPVPSTGEPPHMLGGFDFWDEFMVVTDRFNGKVILVHLHSYRQDECSPPEVREGCASEIIDTIRDPLKAVFAADGSWLLVSSTPFGEVRAYRKAEDSYALSASFSFITPLTTSVSSLLFPVTGETLALAYIEWSKVYLLEVTSYVSAITSRNFSFGTLEVGGVRGIVPYKGGFAIVARNPDVLFLTDEELNPVLSVYPGDKPSCAAEGDGILAVASQQEGTVTFFTLPYLHRLSSLEVCQSPSYIVPIPGEKGRFVVSCFYDQKLLGVDYLEGILWEIP